MGNTPPFGEISERVFRPWYRFGWESPRVLIVRFRNGHRWGFRLRMAWQRARHGYGEDDLWSLDYSLARLIVAGTTYLRDQSHGHPMGITPDEWQGTLEVIRLGFQDWLDADGWLEEGSDEEVHFKYAMENLALWFGGLWD